MVEYLMDLIRMLTTGAFIVRFANQFLKPFCLEKTFVLCAFLVWDNDHVARNTLFQLPNEHRNSWNDPPGPIGFAYNIYNLLSVELSEVQVQDTENAIKVLDGMIESRQMKLMYSKRATHKTGRKRACTISDGAGRGGGGDYTRLRTYGYEVDLEVIADASGAWEPLYMKPDHILTAYRPENPSEHFIAKKVLEESDELEILAHLATIQPKSDHVISLIASFDGWAILPKLVALKGRSLIAREQLEGKIVRVSRGLAYLHGHCIAHMDIKPDNLLVDQDFCLKTIGFDIAIQERMRKRRSMANAERRVGWYLRSRIGKGTVRSKPTDGPVDAFFFYLLDEFKEDDKSLRTFAGDLSVYNSKQRPSLLNWVSHMAPPLSAVKKKAVRPRQDLGGSSKQLRSSRM